MATQHTYLHDALDVAFFSCFQQDHLCLARFCTGVTHVVALRLCGRAALTLALGIMLASHPPISSTELGRGQPPAPNAVAVEASRNTMLNEQNLGKRRRAVACSVCANFWPAQGVKPAESLQGVVAERCCVSSCFRPQAHQTPNHRPSRATLLYHSTTT